MTEKYPVHGVYCRPSLHPVTDIRVIVLGAVHVTGIGCPGPFEKIYLQQIARLSLDIHRPASTSSAGLSLSTMMTR
jgi:hypothetical protein